jgi:hypothetical protein
MSLLLASNVVTLVLTALPVLESGADLDSRGWYNFNDILRLLEPLITLPLQLALVAQGGIITSTVTGSGSVCVMVRWLPLLAFALSAALYQQGAGFHSAAVMLKHPIEELQSTVASMNLTTLYGDASCGSCADGWPLSWLADDLSDMFFWTETVWEHDISHYWYAAGAAGVAAVVAYLYKDVQLPDGLSRPAERAVWMLAVLTYGVLIAAIAIEFPSGSLVALIYLVVYGFGIIGSALNRRGGFAAALSWGRHYVLQYFVAAYAVALVIVVAWIGAQNGFKNRKEAGA